MTKVTEVGPHERMLTITIGADALAKARRTAAARVSKDTKIKGFRPGKAPLQVVESVVGSELLDREAVEDALPKALADAIAETHLRPVVFPRLLDIRHTNSEAEVDVVITLWPTVSKLPKYEKRKVTIQRPLVSDEDIDSQVERMRDQFAELDEVQREGFDGDHVLIDVKTTVNGQEVSAGSTNDLMYEIGSGMLFEGMDDALRGTGAGGIVAFDTVLPEAIGAQGGKSASVRLLVKRVHAKRLPEITDAWVDDVTEFSTIAEMRARLTQDIQTMFDRNSWSRFEQQVVADLVEDVKVDLPDALVSAEMESVFHRFAHRLEQQGVSVEQYLQLTGQTPENFNSDLRSQAEANLRTRILLEAVAEQEDVEVTQAEVDAEIALFAQASGVDETEYRTALVEGGHESTLTGDILRRKAVDRLLELVVPVDENGKAIELPERQTAQPPQVVVGTNDAVDDDEGHTPGEADE